MTDRKRGCPPTLYISYYSYRRVYCFFFYLEAMVGVLGAALGDAQIRKADLVKDHRLST